MAVNAVSDKIKVLRWVFYLDHSSIITAVINSGQEVHCVTHTRRTYYNFLSKTGLRVIVFRQHLVAGFDKNYDLLQEIKVDFLYFSERRRTSCVRNPRLR